MSYPQPLHWWTDNVLPLVYDESLSYYEVMNKIVTYINGITQDTQEVASMVTELKELIENADIDDIPEILAKMDLIDSRLDGDELAIRNLEGILNIQITNISNLTTDNTQNKADIADLKTDNTQNKADIANLETDNTQNKADIANLKTDNTQNKADIANLKTDNTQNKADIADLKTDNTQNKADIADLETDNAQNKTDITGLKNALYYTKQGTTDNFFNSFISTSGAFSNSTKTIVNGRPYNFTYDHVKAIKCQEGYSFIVYGFDTSFSYLGTLRSNGTFNPSSSNVIRYTELDLENYPNVLFRFGVSHFVSGAAVDITPDEANTLTLTYTYNKALTNRSLSVIGDSISTFTGYTNPNAPAAYYPNTTAALRVVDQMYWKALAERNGMTIDTIDSYGGSTVGITWDTTHNYTPFTDESRLSRLGNPNFIIVEGGINDFGGNPLGNYPSDNTYSNMYEFRTSYAYLLNQLKTRYPYAHIVCMSLLTPKTYNNTQFPEKQTEVKQALSSDNTPHYLYEFNNTIKELCERYGCIYCDIYDIVNYYVATTSALGPHPFASGHYFIANRLESLLKDSGI